MENIQHGFLSTLRTPDSTNDDIGETTFQTDFYKLMTSKALRRLGDKTQVITTPNNQHIRTRLIHTNEVLVLANILANMTGLNIDLCNSGAIGHDIGHTPLGHSGEKFISEILGKRFTHAEFGCIVSEQIERKGMGLGLSKETLFVQKEHSKWISDDMNANSCIQEKNIIVTADVISFLFSDINDVFFRGKYLDIEDYPELKELTQSLGHNQRTRVKKCVEAICLESKEMGFVSFNHCHEAEALKKIRAIMNEHIYKKVNVENSDEILNSVLQYIGNNKYLLGANPIVCLALMTDTDVFKLYDKIKNNFIEESSLFDCSVWEIIQSTKLSNINL